MIRRPALAARPAVHPAGLGSRSVGRAAATVVSAGLRALAAAAAGFALTAGLSLILWALSPAIGSDAGAAVQGGAVAFAAAHFLPVSISGTALTLRPLLLTAVMIAVMMTAVGHARPVRGRALETLHAGVFTAVYGIGVAALVAAAAPAGSVQASPLAPAAVAAVGAVLSLVQGATDWRSWWAAAVPEWARRSVRAAMTTMLALVSASAAVLAVALAVSIPDALGIAQLTVHSVGDAIGIVLLCLAFVPNAVIAAIGYTSGAGFSIGAAGYSPLAVHTADLPAVPLLAAVPGAQPGVAAWATILAPILAALIGAATLRRVGASRTQRLAAVVLAALTVGVITAGLVAAGRGGIGGGAWTELGADPLTVGGLIAGMVLLLTGSLVVPAGWASLAWRVEYDADLGAGAGEPAADGLDGAAPEGGVTAAPGAGAPGVGAPGAEGMSGDETARDNATPEDDVISDTEADAEADADSGTAGDRVISAAEAVNGEPPGTSSSEDAAPAARDAQPDDPLADDAAADSEPGNGEPDGGEPGGELAQVG